MTLYIKPLRTDIVLFEANFKRNYIHIRDVCEAIMMTLNNFENLKVRHLI